MSLLPNPLTAEQIAEMKSKMASDLLFLLESSSVPQEIIGRLGELNYLDIETFAHLEEEPKDFKAAIQNDIGLNPSSSPAHRSMMAKLVAVWDSARRRKNSMQQEEADQRASDVPRHLPRGKHL